MLPAARGKNLVMRERTCDIAGNYSTFVKCGMTNQKDKHCFIVGGVAQDSKCELLSEDGIPVWNSIDQSKEEDAKFKKGMVLNFQKLFERVGVLEDDKYRLAKYHIFGQAAVAVRDKVLEPDVFAASGGIVHTWQDLQKALLMKPARKQEKLVNVPDTVVDNLKTRHPIVKPLDFMQLIKFIHAHNRFAHRSLTEVSDVNELVEDMRAFMFKPKDPDAKLGAALLDIVVEKADKIVARSKADVIAWSPAAARSQASTPSTATDATVPHGGFGLQPIMYEEDMV